MRSPKHRPTGIFWGSRDLEPGPKSVIRGKKAEMGEMEMKRLSHQLQSRRQMLFSTVACNIFTINI